MRIKHKTRRPTRKGGKGKRKTMKGGNKSTKDIIDDALKNYRMDFIKKYPYHVLMEIFTDIQKVK